jgi:cytosine/adenosine deaminase-related metal-dependent hydrolase
LAAFSLEAPHGIPVHDPEAALLYALRGTDATFVTVAGRVLVKEGSVSGAAGDPELASRVQAQADGLQEWLHAGGLEAQSAAGAPAERGIIISRTFRDRTS